MQIESLGSLLREHGHADALEAKTVYTLSRADEWYLENGYNGIAAQRGISRPHYWNGDTDALQLSAVCGCVKTIGEDVGSLPLHIYERLRDKKGTEKALGHQLYPRFHDSANPDTTAVEFRESMTATAALHGHSFAKVEHSSSDSSRIIALWQIHNVRIDTDSREQRVFIWKDGNDQEKTLTADEVFYLRGFSATGREPLRFLKVARRVLSLAREQEDYAAEFFDNDRTPGVVLNYANTPKGPNEIENIRNAWIESIKRHGVAVVHSGAKAEQIGSTNTDAQLLEQRNFALLEVCRFFRMPPHKLADLSRANFTNIENENNGYYTNTLRPWLVRWEQAINLRCFPVTERTKYFAAHSVEGFLRGNWKEQTEGWARLLEKGVLCINDVLAWMNMNPVEGGDQHFIQLNMQTLVDAASGLAAETESDGLAPAASAGQSRLFRVKSLR